MATTDIETFEPYNLGTLKELFKKMYARGGDSDFDDTLAGVYLNAAEKYIVSRVGAPKWLQCVKTITLVASTSEYNMELSVMDIHNIRDEANLRCLDYVDRSQWAKYIVKPSETSGTPTSWCKFEYVRRGNTESPEAPYGQLVVHFWPTPSGSGTLYADCQLRPGCMINDSDFPVIPIEFHYVLLEVALMYSGAYDIGSKAFSEHRALAMDWVAEVVRSERRNISGNDRIIPRDEDMRRSSSANPITPSTRRGQLFGR